MPNLSPAADKSLRVLTDVINRIAGQIDFPLGAAEELLRAVATYTTLQMSRAAAAERERIAQLAEREEATYRPAELTVGYEGAPMEKPDPDPSGDPFADLIREEENT